MLTVGAVTLLGKRLATPLQVDKYLTLALEDGYRVGQSRSVRIPSRAAWRLT